MTDDEIDEECRTVMREAADQGASTVSRRSCSRKGGAVKRLSYLELSTRFLYQLQNRSFEEWRYRQEQRRMESEATAAGWKFSRYPEDAPFYKAQLFVNNTLEWLEDVEAALSHNCSHTDSDSASRTR